jgi:hypothetical protein
VPAGSLVFLDLIVSGIYGAKLGDRVVSVNTVFMRIIEAISKNGFWFKIKAAANIKPEEYIRYFEDWL